MRYKRQTAKIQARLSDALAVLQRLRRGAARADQFSELAVADAQSLLAHRRLSDLVPPELALAVPEIAAERTVVMTLASATGKSEAPGALVDAREDLHRRAVDVTRRALAGEQGPIDDPEAVRAAMNLALYGSIDRPTLPEITRALEGEPVLEGEVVPSDPDPALVRRLVAKAGARLELEAFGSLEEFARTATTNTGSWTETPTPWIADTAPKRTEPATRPGGNRRQRRAAARAARGRAKR